MLLEMTTEKFCGPESVVAKTNIFCLCPVVVKVQGEKLVCNFKSCTSEMANFLAEFNYF